MNVVKNERQSNFEFMRIISMFLIVLCHIIGHGQMVEHSSGVLQLVLRSILFLGVVHVNSFVLVSGYFQYKSKFSIHKLLKIINQQWFYKSLITLLFCFFGIKSITNIQLFNNLLPLDMNGNYWFINCYIALYILSPFLNKFIAMIDQKEHKTIIQVLFLLFSVLPMITDGYTVSNTGFTIIQFVFLYLLGAYFHKYPIKNNFHLQRYSKNKRQTLLFVGMMFFCILNFAFSITAQFLTTIPSSVIRQIGEFYIHYSFRYSNIIVILQSICYFLFFETISFKSKWINKIGSYTLAVYLLSDHVYVREYLYHWIKVDQGRSISSLKYIPYIFIWAIIIFVICILIEILRDALFAKIKEMKMYQRCKNFFWKYIQEF